VDEAYPPGNVLAMPEGDTIFRTAETLRAALQGKRITAARPDSLKRFAGRTVTEVTPNGKHLLIRFDNGLAIHSHMRMRGAWHAYRRGEPWRRPAWQVKAVLETDDVVAVCFSAPVVELVRDAETKLGHLGPDVLSDGWDLDEVVSRARAGGATAIGEVLLDQRVTAGIGNVYRCEALWRERLNPWTPVRDLSEERLRRLYAAVREAMRANLGPGFERRFPGYGKGAVHGRAGRPCPRCGTRIELKAQGEHARMTFWCPACQR
jgi:formamidopyrimidine-DNA glycosylase